MARRNLAKITRKHGSFVEDLMMRYFEQKVCDFSVMVLDTNSKSMERFIPKAKQIPKKRETSFHLMSDSVTGKWYTRGKKLGDCQQFIHPFVLSPEYNQ
jgi:hypothetical protein